MVSGKPLTVKLNVLTLTKWVLPYLEPSLFGVPSQFHFR